MRKLSRIVSVLITITLSISTLATTAEVVEEPVTSVATTTTTAEVVDEPDLPEKTTIFVEYQEKITSGDYVNDGDRLYRTAIDGTEVYMTSDGKFYYGGNLHFWNCATFDRLPLGQAIVYQYGGTAVSVGDGTITIYRFGDIVDQINIETGIDGRDDMSRKLLLLEEYRATLNSGAYAHDPSNNRYYIALVEGCTSYLTIDGQFWSNGKLEFENVAVLDRPIAESICYQYCGVAVAKDRMHAYVYAYGQLVDVIDLATGESTQKCKLEESRKARIVELYKAALREDKYRHDNDKRFIAYVDDIECYQTLDGTFFYGEEVLYNYFATCDKVDDIGSFVYKDHNTAVVVDENFIYVYSCGEIISVINLHTGEQPLG